MGAIGEIIDSAVGAITGKPSGTSLQDFLANFSSSEGIWAKTIDPYSSFDVSIKFYPTPPFPSSDNYEEQKNAQTAKPDWKDTLEKSVDSAIKSTVTSFANNITGGLVGAIINSELSVMAKHNENTKAYKNTFMEYLAPASLIVGKDGQALGQSITPLEIQLGIYCQEVTLPNFEVPQAGSSANAFGEFPINGLFVKTDSNVLTLKIVNTKVPLHERIFYPWLRETTMNWWAYDEQPYTTATITVDLTKHQDIKYVFCGCRPQKITMVQPTHDSSSPNLTRDVSFLFDYMMVTSSLANCESLTDKLLSTGTSLVKGAGSMVNI